MPSGDLGEAVGEACEIGMSNTVGAAAAAMATYCCTVTSTARAK